MNLAEFSISKSVITWTIMFLLLVVGLISFGGLPRLEDPEFTIKEALILTPYPGTPLFDRMEKDGRILTRDWSKYNQIDVVFNPKNNLC